MSDDRLKSLADRIEKLMDERDGIQGDIRDVYAEAKSAGYVPKVLRKAITRKRMDPSKRDEEDTILDLYEDALSPKMRRAVEMARSGASARQIERETGIDQATVARSVSLNKKSETPEGATTDRRDRAASDVGNVAEPEADPESAPRPSPPLDAQSDGSTEALDRAAARLMDQSDGEITVQIEASPGSVFDRLGQALERVAPGRVERTVVAPDDDRTIPHFLRRVPA